MSGSVHDMTMTVTTRTRPNHWTQGDAMPKCKRNLRLQKGVSTLDATQCANTNGTFCYEWDVHTGCQQHKGNCPQICMLASSVDWASQLPRQRGSNRRLCFTSRSLTRVLISIKAAHLLSHHKFGCTNSSSHRPLPWHDSIKWGLPYWIPAA